MSLMQTERVNSEAIVYTCILVSHKNGLFDGGIKLNRWDYMFKQFFRCNVAGLLREKRHYWRGKL